MKMNRTGIISNNIYGIILIVCYFNCKCINNVSDKHVVLKYIPIQLMWERGDFRPPLL